ncbi:DUF2182 domain-containing protein [Aquisalimonas asiatica]|uniref:Predicted metal-binding membrane protein n=1 Tax=Aquisalimonas asiatica TaxID=406100 RepID=A0A1H8RKD1_9GAMM|nr:DUF2182 domain-containing protein [Aquisalimonas asiatica]SEO66644.1 Predicted metal-binding membrane protein [Aquisalimonas asiatica]
MSTVTAPRNVWLASPVLLAVIASAWLLGLTAEFTGHAQWIHHHRLVTGDMSLAASLALLLLAWQVHIAAMMLPSSLPMIRLFARTAARQPHPGTAHGAFIGGYLLVWTAFGVGALTLHNAVLAAGHHWHWLAHRPEWLAGGALVLAGAFQFSGLKNACLRHCRHPGVFLMAHYRRGRLAALHLGLRHGLFCIGCCWALMLVMVVVGIANLAWMAPLALLMLYEKTGAYGDRVVKPVGIGLIVLGTLLLLAPEWTSVGHDHHGVHGH